MTRFKRKLSTETDPVEPLEIGPHEIGPPETGPNETGPPETGPHETDPLKLANLKQTGPNYGSDSTHLIRPDLYQTDPVSMKQSQVPLEFSTVHKGSEGTSDPMTRSSRSLDS